MIWRSNEKMKGAANWGGLTSTKRRVALLARP